MTKFSASPSKYFLGGIRGNLLIQLSCCCWVVQYSATKNCWACYLWTMHSIQSDPTREAAKDWIRRMPRLQAKQRHLLICSVRQRKKWWSEIGTGIQGKSVQRKVPCMTKFCPFLLSSKDRRRIHLFLFSNSKRENLTLSNACLASTSTSFAKPVIHGSPQWHKIKFLTVKSISIWVGLS